jgi:hypothetical protein
VCRGCWQEAEENGGAEAWVRCPVCERGVIQAREGELSFGRPLEAVQHSEEPNGWSLWGQPPPYFCLLPWSHQPFPRPPFSFSVLADERMPGELRQPGGGAPAHPPQ